MCSRAPGGFFRIAPPPFWSPQIHFSPTPSAQNSQNVQHTHQHLANPSTALKEVAACPGHLSVLALSRCCWGAGTEGTKPTTGVPVSGLAPREGTGPPPSLTQAEQAGQWSPLTHGLALWFPLPTA